jgi:hypothetical protein
MADLSVDSSLLTKRSPALSINSKVAIVAYGAPARRSGGARHDHLSWRQSTLYLLGGALGLPLYHALFGFTSGWGAYRWSSQGKRA